MLNNITLVIPTHNRHKYLTRLLDFYSSVEIKIFIADSTQKKYNKIDNSNVTYLHYPNTNFFEKLSDTFKKIETDYVFMCADDDFIIPSAIEKCCNFLDKNKDFSSVQGYYVSFINTYNHVHYFNTYPNLKNYYIRGDTPEERLNQQMSSYFHHVYSVHRTLSLKQAFNLKPLKNLNLIELVISIVSVLNGKHRILPFLYCFRQTIPDSASVKIERLETIVNNPEMKAEFIHFKAILSEFTSQKLNISLEKSETLISESIESFLTKLLPASNERTNFYPKLVRKIHNKLLKQIRPIFPDIFNKLLFKFRLPHYDYYSSYYMIEFKEIKEYVKKHNKDHIIVLKRVEEVVNNAINALHLIKKVLNQKKD